jgi:hypothetical protein
MTVSQWFRRVSTPPEATVMPIASPEPPPDMATSDQPKSAKSLLPAALGDRVRDPITGFTGIVVVVARFLSGNVRCIVQPERLQDGLPQAEQYFDQARLEVVDKGAFAPSGPPRALPALPSMQPYNRDDPL